MFSMANLIEYLSKHAVEPVQRHVFVKDVLCEPPNTSDAYALLTASKWYAQLTREQRPDGSWGRFHTQDTKDPVRRVFVTTEHALRRARDLGLTKHDTFVARAIDLMAQYLSGETTWLDTNEKHFGFEVAFRTLIAANLSLFAPTHPLVEPYQRDCIQHLALACADGTLDETIWERANHERYVILLRAYMVYPFWLAQTNANMDETLQRQYLAYIWHRREGMYYISNVPPCETPPLESGAFMQWFSCLENLRGFSLFPEFMHENAAHLLCEAERLIHDGVAGLPRADAVIGHYAESWRVKGARETDLLLRMARVLKACGAR